MDAYAKGCDRNRNDHKYSEGGWNPRHWWPTTLKRNVWLNPQW
jgi:hypothetical protein